MGKCPKCENHIETVDVEVVGINYDGKIIQNGMSYICRHCETVLSIAIDPYFIIRKTIKGVLNPDEEI